MTTKHKKYSKRNFNTIFTIIRITTFNKRKWLSFYISGSTSISLPKFFILGQQIYYCQKITTLKVVIFYIINIVLGLQSKKGFLQFLQSHQNMIPKHILLFLLFFVCLYYWKILVYIRIHLRQ